ncbi:membrane dipeptidase [Bacteriovoracaceae bacterium]|nr:membrane dipeptidase [Bacteriovoracaceae bacterium]
MKKISLIDLHSHMGNILSPFPWVAEKILKQEIDLIKILNRYEEKKEKIIIVTNFYLVYPLENSYKNFIDQKRKIEKQIESINQNKKDSIKVIQSKNDLDDDFTIGIIWAIESCRWMKDYKVILPKVWQEGVRMLTPIHFLSNFIGATCNEPYVPYNQVKGKFLTTKGREFLRISSQMGFMLDLSHMHAETLNDAIDVIKDNLLFSHIGLADFVPFKRNVLLSTMKKISQKNSLIGLIAWKKLIKNEEIFFRNINHLVHHKLENHIGIGTDYGAPINTLRGLRDYSSIEETINGSNLDASLKSKIMADNAFEFIKKALPV